MIGLEGLVLRRDGFRLTADASLPEGSITALIGPSGAGKSTLLDAFAGFLAPEAGRITIAGRDMAGLAPAERPVSILFQDHNLFPHLDVAQNLGLGIRSDLRLSVKDRRAVEAVLADVGLAGMAARRPAALSGGQRQRVALARALLRRRPVLLLDEPFAGLDPALRKEMLDLVARMARRQAMTVVMVTHLPEDARRIAGLTALISGGRLHPPQPTATAFDKPSPEMAAYLGA
ncbi:MAG: ATP-binding cassette domain-containing protein [Alphaproteobacteria bacterium]|nr:MAG: ATP-binding cassette domain-containing protein [Alphaproteobacteria bacterium]